VPAVAACTLPRFIVPPRSEREGFQPTLFELDDVPDISGALAKHWRDRPAFIDPKYLLDEYGRDRAAIWLPKMFERVRRFSAKPIPMAHVRDLEDQEAAAFRAAISPDGSLRFGIRVSSGDIDIIGPELAATVKAVLGRLGLSPDECAVIADFHDADFSDPTLVAPIISGVLETLQDLGSWQLIAFQGTHYPDKNPAKEPGSRILWPRNEWIAWKDAVRFDPATADHMIFGDYAADCATIEFGSARARAIRHYRYTTESAWLVERGEESGIDAEIMQQVCRKIVDSVHFAGSGFSSADAYIHRTANHAAGPGNATTWRQVNTTHHITRVVADIGKVRGVAIAERATGPLPQQFSFL
jgi:hypothetical protein